jgi:hypothetical protein
VHDPSPGCRLFVVASHGALKRSARRRIKVTEADGLAVEDRLHQTLDYARQVLRRRGQRRIATLELLDFPYDRVPIPTVA